MRWCSAAPPPGRGAASPGSKIILTAISIQYRSNQSSALAQTSLREDGEKFAAWRRRRKKVVVDGRELKEPEGTKTRKEEADETKEDLEKTRDSWGAGLKEAELKWF